MNASSGRKEVFLIYEKVKRFADAQNISISALEKKAGLKNGTIGKWRYSSPILRNLQAVADALGISINELLEG